MKIIDVIACAIADEGQPGSQYNRTGKPEIGHYMKAERVVAALKKVGYTTNIEEGIYSHVQASS
jgi:hypothetical protein